MIYDYKNRRIAFENPGEEIDFNNHMAEYGPGTVRGEHPDDCKYCAEKGWNTWTNKTTFQEACDKWHKEHGEE